MTLEPQYSVFKHTPVGEDIFIEYYDDREWAKEWVIAANTKLNSLLTYYYIKENWTDFKEEINYK